MSRHSIKELTRTLGISRGRVYQIINSLTGDKKVSKDANGNYILDDKAFHDIRLYFEANTMKSDENKSNEQRIKLAEQIDSLKKKNIENERKIDSLAKQIKIQKELIDTLKENNHTLTKQLNIKDEQIAKSNQLADQAQSLNLLDKKKIEEPEKKKHWWQ